MATRTPNAALVHREVGRRSDISKASPCVKGGGGRSDTPKSLPCVKGGGGRSPTEGLLKGSIMIRKHNPSLVGNAKALRKEMTPEERHLWYDFLRTYPVRFLRQKILGRYIVDFYCAQARIVVELDGSQHYDEKQKGYDAERTAFLSGYGLCVLRISNTEVNRNFRGVCEWIDLEVKKGIKRERDNPPAG